MQYKKNIKYLFLLSVATLLLLLLPCLVHTTNRDSQRIRVGVDLFPSILAADVDISSKVGPDDMLLLIVHYTNAPEVAQGMATLLGAVAAIRGIPLRIEISNDPSFSSYSTTQVAGIFIVQKLAAQHLAHIVQFGKAHHVVVFSPFEGDVEKGTLGGIVISDRILPYINLKTMKESGIVLKPFFLRIAKSYE